MPQGTVKWFDAEKGFGFIVPDDGSAELFIYYTEVQGPGFRTLQGNQRVEYEVGLQAVGIRSVEANGRACATDTTRVDPIIESEGSLGPTTDMHAGSSRSRWLPAQLVGRGFTSVRSLGTGGESEVLLCRDGQGGEVAVKIYHAGRSPQYALVLGSDDYRRSFGREWSVEVFERDVDALEGRHYEVMEFCSGGTLEDIIGAAGCVDDRAVAIVRRLAWCIKSLQGDPPKTVHGDIKPTNILVRDAETLELVLADFGLTENLGDRTSITNIGQGTAAYSAPEIPRSKGTKADWWSLGMVVYRMLVGHSYYQGPFGFFGETSRVPDEISLVAIDRAEMADERRSHWKLLLTGLLRWDPDSRWGAEEVEAWLVGRSPDVKRR